jgi:hypothetical protein
MVEEFLIRKPENPAREMLEIDVAIVVYLLLFVGHVDSAVELDDETLLATVEVDDEPVDPVLTPELEPEKLTTAKQLPQDLLRRSLPTSKPACQLDETEELWIIPFHVPPSYPMVRGGRGRPLPGDGSGWERDGVRGPKGGGGGRVVR